MKKPPKLDEDISNMQICIAALHDEQYRVLKLAEEVRELANKLAECNKRLDETSRSMAVSLATIDKLHNPKK